MDKPVGGTIKVGAVTVDRVARRAFVGDKEIALTEPEFEVLETFVRHPDQVLSAARLRELAWEHGQGPATDVVDAHILELRRKLGDDLIESVTDAGYRFVGHRRPYA